jgi:hypothetical protein
LGSEFTHTASIVPGDWYQFKIRAKNKWGYGAHSEVLEVIAAAVPYRVDIPVSTIDPLTGGVQIEWAAPYENGAVISAYQIEIQDYNGLWQVEGACDGSDAGIVAATLCIVPMADLRNNLALNFDMLIYARVSASNVMGQGAWS